MGACVITLGGAFLLKWWYSVAAVGDLLWILHPVAQLVSLITGSNFEYEIGFGFFSAEHAFVIAPSCAGVNFLIICVCSLVFAGIGRVRSDFSLVVKAFLVAYATTVVANTMRILMALAIPGPALTHRVEGIAVFLFFLFLQQAMWERSLDRA